MDGDPHYALRDQHAVPLSTLDAVAAYNAAAAANERFDGLHFDTEPYLLLDWRDPRLREQLLEDFLDLNARAAAAAHDAGLAYGADIPFWWASIDDATGEATGIVTFRGTRQAASYHLLAIVDNLGIRRVPIPARRPARGHPCRDCLARAFRIPAGAPPDAATASAQAAFRREGDWLDVQPRSIVAGDATFAGASATVMTPPKLTFAGKSLSEMNRQLAEAETTFSAYRYYAGIAIHDYAAFSRLAGAARERS